MAVRPLYRGFPITAGRDTDKDTLPKTAHGHRFRPSWLAASDKGGLLHASLSLSQFPQVSQVPKEACASAKRSWHIGLAQVPRLADGKQVNPAAACPAADPCPGALCRRSGMAICQAVKDRVLSRGRSPVFGQGEGWHRDSPVGRSSVEACLSLPAQEVWEASSWVRAFRDKGQGPIRVKGGAASLPASQVPSAKRRSASRPVMAGGLIALWRQTEAP